MNSELKRQCAFSSGDDYCQIHPLRKSLSYLSAPTFSKVSYQESTLRSPCHNVVSSSPPTLLTLYSYPAPPGCSWLLFQHCHVSTPSIMTIPPIGLLGYHCVWHGPATIFFIDAQSFCTIKVSVISWNNRNLIVVQDDHSPEMESRHVLARRFPSIVPVLRLWTAAHLARCRRVALIAIWGWCLSFTSLFHGCRPCPATNSWGYIGNHPSYILQTRNRNNVTNTP